MDKVREKVRKGGLIGWFSWRRHTTDPLPTHVPLVERVRGGDMHGIDQGHDVQPAYIRHSQISHHPHSHEDHGHEDHSHEDHSHEDHAHEKHDHHKAVSAKDDAHAVHHGHDAPVSSGHHGHVSPHDQDHASHGHEAHGHGDHDHGEHGHHEVVFAKGTGGYLELHGNTLHLVKGGFFGFCVGLLGLHGGHAHQTIKVSDISAIEFEKHGFLFHYVRFSYPGAPLESGNHLHDMMADNALLMSLFDNRPLYRLKEKLEEAMHAGQETA